MAQDEDIQTGLAELIRVNVPGAEDVGIESLRRIVGGNSSEIWAFDARWREAGRSVSHSLILRRAAPNEFGSAGRAAEFQLLQALAPTSVPAPRAQWFDSEGEYLARPAMVMERAEGNADRQVLCAGDADARIRLAGEMADLLADLHRLEPGELDIADDMRPAGHPAQSQLDFYDSEIRRQQVEPMPELRLASLWLHDNLPDLPARNVLVHGDFRPANLLVANGQVTALLDWEFAHVGDPVEDLGWYLAPYYAAEHLIPGLWTAQNFLDRYEAALGTTVDRAALNFWSVFALYKLASMTVAALRAFADGDASRMAPSARFILNPLLEAIAGAERVA